MDVSFQLYSARSLEDQHGFLKTLAGLGYTQVEGYGGVYDAPEQYREAMDAAGITMPSGHFALSDLENSFVHQMALAKKLGIQRIYVPYLAVEDRPKESAGYKAIAQRMSVLGEKIQAEGFEFGWHNHDFEMESLADGGIPMEILLTEAPGISWEGDMAWVHYAGADPFEWVNKFGSRLSSVHVKDVAVAGEKADEDGWADVGDGVIDWKSLIAEIRAVAPNALIIVEHDKPSDVMRFATTSFKNLTSY